MPDAIILAGGTAADGSNKAFLDGAGHPFVWHVAQALARTAAVARVVAVGPVERLTSACGGLLAGAVPEHGTIMDNVVAALSALPGARHVLAVASDIPLVHPAALEEFLRGCEKEEADFYYGIVPQAVLEERYPGARKTFVRVVDGSFTGASVMLFNPAIVDRVRAFVERVLQARKKPWLLASLFGWATVMRLASGKLSIREMEARAQEVTGIVPRAVVVRHPELALDADVDRPENLAIIHRELAARARA